MNRLISIAQVNPLVGDIPGNTCLVLEMIQQAQKQGVRVLVFPELMLTGYPPEDLLLRPALNSRIQAALHMIAEAAVGVYVVVGYPWHYEDQLFNAAGVFLDGKKIAEYHKQCLPNYQVFDEKRYFVAGNSPCVFLLDDLPVALSVCEDIWHPEPMQQAQQAGARLMLNLNASPFHRGKQIEREQMLCERAREGGMPILYANMVGGQDELVFDGGSCAVNAEGEIVARAPAFNPAVMQLSITVPDNGFPSVQSLSPVAAHLDESAAIYQALVVGVRDYVIKNRFPGAVLGLSGGIDSALTLAIAVDALAPACVEAVMMPYRYTSDMSLEDAETEARALGVKYSVIAIEPAVEALTGMLTNSFADQTNTITHDVTEQNLQARCRVLC